MTDERPSPNDPSFASFWQRSVDKISSKTLKFMPNVTKPTNANQEEQGERPQSAATQKAHRRAQVRKAQLEHRQRKQNYVQHLEEDVLRLREMIAATQSEAAALEQENKTMKTTLSFTISTTQGPDVHPNVQTPLLHPEYPMDASQPTICTPAQLNDSLGNLAFSESHQPNVSFGDTTSYLTAQDNMLSGYVDTMMSPGFQNSDSISNTNSMLNNAPMLTYSSAGQSIPYGPTIPSNTHISVEFDEFINSTCLHLSPGGISSDSTNAFTGYEGIDLDWSTIDFSKPLSPVPAHMCEPQEPIPAAKTLQSPTPDTILSMIAINFILALEYPCRTHFHQTPSPGSCLFADGGSGHEMMATSYIYTSAPTTAFNFKDADTADTSWPSPCVSLAQLHSMAQSLPSSEIEITPVQAWFMMVDKYDVRRVVEDKRLEELKKGLGPLARCCAFGTVMDVGKFWEVVDEVMKE